MFKNKKSTNTPNLILIFDLNKGNIFIFYSGLEVNMAIIYYVFSESSSRDDISPICLGLTLSSN